MASPAHHAHWIREEAAAMAAITFHTMPKEPVPEQLKTVLTACRDMLDVFVSN
jgi:hypothetical protein